jgi:hypothetical protein
MAEYKDVYYADSSLPMSAGDISYAEAVSVGDKVEEIYYDTPIVVDDVMMRSLTFENPVQGDACWRVDLGVEQRYYEAYHAKRNPGGKSTAGWYATTSAIRPIIPTGVGMSPTTATYSQDLFQFGEVSFTNANSVTVNNCFFYDTDSTFSSYKVLVDISSTSGTFAWPLWSFRKNNVLLSSVTYNSTYQGVSASTNSGAAYSHPFAVPATMQVPVYTLSLELNLEAQMPLLGSSTNYSIAYNSQSWAYTTASNNSLHMLSGAVQTTTLPSDFYLANDNGLMKMTGTIKIYGIG